MKNYNQVDVIAFLESVVEKNTKSYKTDFEYDAASLTEAAKHPDWENRKFLWMSRRCGTWCVIERDAYIRNSNAYVQWTHYLGTEDRIIAFAVEITGWENERVIGNLYKLDYNAHAKRVEQCAEEALSATLVFRDGSECHMPYSAYYAKRNRLSYDYPELSYVRLNPSREREPVAALESVRSGRAKR